MNANNIVDGSTQLLASVDDVLERFFSLSTTRAASLAPTYEGLGGEDFEAAAAALERVR